MPRKSAPSNPRAAIEKLLITMATQAELTARRGELNVNDFVGIMNSAQRMFAELREHGEENTTGIGANIDAVARALEDGAIGRETRRRRGRPPKDRGSEGGTAGGSGAEDSAGLPDPAADGDLPANPVESAGAALSALTGPGLRNGPDISNPNRADIGGDDDPSGSS